MSELGGVRFRLAAIGACAALTASLTSASAGAATGLERAYAANNGGNDVSQYAVSSTGALSPLSPKTAPAGPGPDAVAIAPNGKSVYVVDAGGAEISQFTVVGGLLKPRSPATVPAGAGADEIAVSPNGRSVYVTDSGAGFGSQGEVSEYNVASGGALVPKNPATVPAGTNPLAVAVAPNGKSVYVTSLDEDVEQFNVGAGGSLTPKATPTIPAGASPDTIAISPSGQSVYVGNDGSASVSQYTVGAGGELSAKTPATVPAGTNPESVAVSPNGRNVYVANGGDDDVSQFSVGPGGALSPKNPATVPAVQSEPDGIALTPDGRRLYLTTNIGVVSEYTVSSTGLLSRASPEASPSGPSSEAVAVAPDQAPRAAFTATVRPAGSATLFNAGSSSAFTGTIARYAWIYGDGKAAPNGGAHPSHVYAHAGRYKVTLTVTDSSGCSTRILSTGIMPYCNGGQTARLTRVVTVPAH